MSSFWFAGEKKLYFFQAESESMRRNWINVIEHVSRAELPKGVHVTKPLIAQNNVHVP